MNMTSFVELVFDDKLVSFTKDAKLKFNRELIILSQELNEVSRNHVQKCMEIQEAIREYMIKNQYNLTFVKDTFRLSKRPPSHSTLFALFMCIMSDIDECSSFDDVMYQIDSDNLECSALLLEYEEDDANEGACACGHRVILENIYVINNYYTGLKSWVGCDCVNKNKLVTKEAIQQLKNNIKNSKYCVEKAYQKANPDKRCDTCKKPHKNANINRCDGCRKGRCDGCDKNIVAPYKVCYGCHARGNKTELIGKCLQCKSTIKGNYTYCFRCHQNSN